MPLYEFRCPDGHDFEKFYRSIGSAAAEEKCPVCGMVAVRLMSTAGLVFKGSGFYITDYARQDGDKGKPDKAASEKAKDAKSDAAAADKGGSSETKTDTATKTEGTAKSDPPPKPATPSPAPSASSTKD